MTNEVDSTSTDFAVPYANSSFRELAKRFLELIRFSHTVFALPFALLACVLALTTQAQTTQALSPQTVTTQATTLEEFSPLEDWGILIPRLLGVLLCMVFARSAAMAFNRLVDAKIDAENPRTATRHLPAGLLSRKQVSVFFLLNCSAFLASCLLFLPNWLPIALSVPVLAWICGYSLAKRFTSGAHLWLGVALALSPICAWIAIRGEYVLQSPADILPPSMLAAAIALWVAGFDIIYACQDADFDRNKGLHSVPARFGVAGAMKISATFHFAMLLALASLPFCFPQLPLGWLYLVAVACVAVLVFREHAIVSPDDMRRVGEAFFTINAIISVGLCAIAMIDAILL